MNKFFNYIFSKSSVTLFYTALTLSILLTASYFYLLFYYPQLLVVNLKGDFVYKNITLLGKFYMISGIFPNFLFLIIIFRFIRFILKTILQLIGWILGIIFSNKNFEKLEKIFSSNKPKVKKVVKKINLKKNEKQVFWIVPIIALVIGIMPMPIGYFMLSRLIVCVGALYFTQIFYKKKLNTKLWIFGFFAVLYNPIIPFYLYAKPLWIMINIPTIYYFYINRRYV